MTIPAEAYPLLAVIGLGGFGTWLILPHSHGLARAKAARGVGFLLVLVATTLLLSYAAAPPPMLTTLFFYIFAFAAVLGGVLMIASVSPIYSALWFATVVLATAGLLLETGAQFLAAATVIVYAGAIIVTFLFVVMLASVSGRELYDRSSRMPGRATLAGTLLLWTLLTAIQTTGSAGAADGEKPAGIAAALPVPATAPAPPSSSPPLVRSTSLATRTGSADPAAASRVLAASLPPRARLPQHESALLPGVPPRHVASLGGTLFTDHLIAVQIAGVLLFIALVAGASIARPKPIIRPSTRGRLSVLPPAPMPDDPAPR